MPSSSRNIDSQTHTSQNLLAEQLEVSKEKEAKKKSHTAIVSWIRKKFSKVGSIFSMFLSCTNLLR